MRTAHSILAWLWIAIPQKSFAVSTSWEALRPDLSNVRGLNYVPMEERGLAPHGTANAVVSWRYFNPEAVARQVALLKSHGFNALRVFLSYEAWLHGAEQQDRNPFLTSFKTLMDVCEQNQIYLMPVLWNAFSPTGINDQYEQLEHWGRSPGHENMNREWIQSTLANRYVSEVVRIAQNYRALFAYDVANEPDAGSQEYFLTHFARLIRSLDANPRHFVTVGFARLTENEPAMARIHRYLNLVSFHPYYFFPSGTRRAIETARAIAASIAPHTPILATEAGSPGFLSRYKEQWGILASHRVGAMPWVAFIDRRGSTLAYNNASGYFCIADGAARDLEEVSFLRALAHAHGAAADAPMPSRMDEGSRCEPQATPVGYGTEETIRDLAPSAWLQRPSLTDSNANTFEGYTGQILRLAQAGLGLLELWSNVDRPVISQGEAARVNEILIELLRRHLVGGSEPWRDSRGQVDWPRYDALFSDSGRALHSVIARHRLWE